MRPLPPLHQAYDHGRLLQQLERDARRRFHQRDRAWDPARASDARSPDLGRGLLDCYALALHVLWTYHQAWAEEGFLPSARLDDSVHRLLDLIGYRPRPATSADGFQHFRIKRGMSTTLPPGFRVQAAGRGEQPGADFETLNALHASDALNELRPFLPGSPAQPVITSGAIATAAESALLETPEVRVPGPGLGDGGAAGSALAEQLEGRVGAARAGDQAQRNAARARKKALQLADFINDLQAADADSLCSDSIDQLCRQLCEQQQLASAATESMTPGMLSESQELLLSQLAAMGANRPAALDGLAQAMARGEDEPAEAFSARLDKLANFLDSLVAGLIQEARDQVVRLRGSRALTRLDDSYRDAGGRLGGNASERGIAPPGTDALYLLPQAGTNAEGPRTQTDLLHPGDWLVIAEETRSTDPQGNPVVERRYHQALQIVRIRDEIVSGSTEATTWIQFRPPLLRRYVLSRALLLGNIAPISHGASETREIEYSANRGRLLDLARQPLSWLRDPAAADGRRPQAELEVAGRAWQRVDDLREQGPAAAVFAVEQGADGEARLRVGDGRQGATPPLGARLTLRYRVGAGDPGNRDALAVADLAGANPAVVATFNPLSLSGGAVAEDPAYARHRAADGIHALDRAISLNDLRSLALGFGGIQCARVFRDPLRRREQLRLIVCGDYARPLTDDELGDLHAFLIARLPPGSGLTVGNHSPLALSLRLKASISPGSDPLAVITALRLALGLDAAPAGGDTAVSFEPGLLHPSRVRLGVDVLLSDIYRAAAGIANLDSLSVERFHRLDAPPGRSNRIEVRDHEVALWGATGSSDGQVGDPVDALTGDPVEILWQENRQP